MKKNENKFLTMDNMYVGIQIEQFNQENYDVISFKILEKTPYFIKGNKNVQIYNDPFMETNYYLMRDDNTFIPMNIHNSEVVIYFKHLKSLNEIFNKCTFKLRNCSNITIQDFLSYRISIEKIKTINNFSKEDLFCLEDMIYNLYCYAYERCVREEIDNDDDFDPPKTKKKKNPKKEK